MTRAEAPDPCDHTHHNDSYESHDFDLLDDDCLLCVRQLLFDDPQFSPDADHHFSGFAWLLWITPDKTHINLLSIRGPPHVA